MIRGILTIDQTPCRASYGLLTPSALLTDLVRRQRAAVMENIGNYAATGDRLARIENPANRIESIAAERNDEPLTVGLKNIDRPVIRFEQASGLLDITV